MSELRKPRLTTQLLDDLDVAIAVLRDEIAYLVEAVTQHADVPHLRAQLHAKRVSLERAEAWLSRHVAAVRDQRENAVEPDSFQPPPEGGG